MMDIEKVIEEARAAVLPFESWERLTGESTAAFATFCAYRDYGPERNIRRAVEVSEKDETKQGKRYRLWRGWASAHRWRERAADYDSYVDKLKQAELRKTIEEQGKVHRMVTGKMLQVVSKKLDLMDPGELAQGTVTDWVSTAIRAEREAANQRFDGLVTEKDKPEGQTEKNGQITFTSDFEGL
jgi:hypothetical protein